MKQLKRQEMAKISGGAFGGGIPETGVPPGSFLNQVTDFSPPPPEIPKSIPKERVGDENNASTDEQGRVPEPPNEEILEVEAAGQAGIQPKLADDSDEP